ncbi:cyclase/dehydrase [Streptomyces himastatinicus ATCC 53653]|uniref:Cyclase/dehydrase n=1 Tax=Streptomyces himastatinicus ATCC 53653 TaxID=457427 RepID=D9WRB2_9ACTN|nr:cyclase/dehydrase [Streptomyces himastatinicus ATCC 53653]
MADTLGKLKDDIVRSPAADRLKDELQSYVQARATHALTGLGTGLAKGTQALAEGKPPGQAVLKAGTSQLKETLKDKVKGMFGKGRGKSGGGKSKSVTVVEDIDVGVPVREAYDQWTQFQEFSTFAKGVVSVEKADDTSSNWKVKVAKSTRSWKANVTEQVPDERISWTTEGAKGTVKGVVTFHPLGDSLTRVLLVLEYFPKGLFERTGNIWRAQGRRARTRLEALPQVHHDARRRPRTGWRGEIRERRGRGRTRDGRGRGRARRKRPGERPDEPRAEQDGEGRGVRGGARGPRTKPRPGRSPRARATRRSSPTRPMTRTPTSSPEEEYEEEPDEAEEEAEPERPRRRTAAARR